MIVLAIDTTSEFASAAVRVNGQTEAEVHLHSRDGFGHLLFPAIDELLRKAGLKLADIDRFAGASGPGAFTGVRLDLAAVKGMAEAMQRPAVGVSNLRALSVFGHLTHRAVVLDARRGEIFAAVYDANLRVLAFETVIKMSDWLQQLRLDAYEFIAQDLPLLASSLEGTRFEKMPRIEAPRHLAPAIAQCAELDEGTGPAVLDANYVRRCDAGMPPRDAQRGPGNV